MPKKFILHIGYGVLLLAIFSFLTTSSSFAFSGSGAGTSESPYIITTCDQLQEMKDDLNKDYKLGNDIDCSATIGWNAGAGFEQIGTYSSEFTGSFDGDRHTISQLFINRPSTSRIGLFGKTNGATIENLILSDIDITGSYSVGGLAGETENTTIKKIVISGGSVTMSDYNARDVGGLVGNQWNTSTISDVYVTATVDVTDMNAGAVVNAGGLVGLNQGAITNSYSAGSVTVFSNYAGLGYGNAGGLVGYNAGYANAKILNSFAAGSVSSNLVAGGVVGYCYGGSITNSYSVVSSLCGDTSTTTVDGGSSGGVSLASFYNTTPLHAVYTGTPVWDFDSTWIFLDTNSLPDLSMQVQSEPNDEDRPVILSGNSSVSAPSCGDEAPRGAPDLFEINTNASQAQLYFAPVSDNTNKYVISYGYTSGDMRFGTEWNGNSTGVISSTLNYLTPNTTYYVRVRAGNGCATGDWSNEMKITTTKNESTNGYRFYKGFVTQIIASINSLVSF